MLAERIRAAQEEEAVPAAIDPDDMARFLTVFVFGLPVAGKASLTGREVRSLIDTAMGVLS